MKPEDLVVGKWYTSDQWSRGSYAKFERYEKNSIEFNFIFNEKINANLKYHIVTGSWFMPTELREVPYNEIKEYLPENYIFHSTIENTIDELITVMSKIK